MKKFLFVSIGIIALLLFIAIARSNLKTFTKSKQVHYHAGFQIYVDGKLQYISHPKYMLIKPCRKDGVSADKEDKQLEKAHLHDGVGDVVHIEAEGAKWKDLFQNIHFKIDSSKPIEGYVNGKKVNNILDYPIKSFDRVVIFIGKVEDKEEKLKHQVTRKKIEEVGKKSETCGEEK